MKNVLMAAILIVAAIAATTQFSVGDLMPSPAIDQRERLKSFAQSEGLDCEWLMPTIFLYLKSGRPELRPNAVCRNQRQGYDAKMTTAEYVENLKHNFANRLEEIFKSQPTIVGVRMSGAGAPLVCFTPQPQPAWSVCTEKMADGCLFAKCTALSPPQE